MRVDTHTSFLQLNQHGARVYHFDSLLSAHASELQKNEPPPSSSLPLGVETVVMCLENLGALLRGRLASTGSKPLRKGSFQFLPDQGLYCWPGLGRLQPCWADILWVSHPNCKAAFPHCKWWRLDYITLPTDLWRGLGFSAPSLDFCEKVQLGEKYSAEMWMQEDGSGWGLCQLMMQWL